MTTPDTTTLYGRLAPGVSIGPDSFADLTDAEVVDIAFVSGGLLAVTFAGVLSDDERAAICLRLASTGPDDEAARGALLTRAADLRDLADVGTLLRDLTEFLLRPCIEPEESESP